jgi:hypothetical protein
MGAHRFVFLAAAAALAACASAGPRAKEPVTLASDGPLDGVRASLPHERFTLANGLEVIVAPDPNAEDVAVLVRYHAGSRDDPQGREGTAHLVEHLTFVSLRGLPQDTALSFLYGLGAVGANASTRPDSTDYYGKVRPEGLERMLWLERQRMHAALDGVTGEAFERERAVVRDEMRVRRLPWAGLMPRIAGEVVFPPSHPYARVVASDDASLRRIDLDGDARAFYRRHYGPNHATLVLTGRVDVARARRLAERWFGDLPPIPPRPSEELEEVRVAGPKRIERTAPVARATVLVAWPMPPAQTLDAECAEAALDGSPGGVIGAVGTSARYVNWRSWTAELGGVAAMWFEAEDDDGLASLTDRIERALDAAVVPHHYARSHRTRAIAGLLAELDGLQSRAELLADAGAAGDPVAQRLTLVRSVVDEEIEAALRDRTRRRDRRVVVLVRPPREGGR